MLEHADDIEHFIREITRVGQRGYIETPSAIAEWMFGWPYHRWVLVRDGETLRIARKKMSSPAGPVFHHLYNNNLPFQLVFYSYLDLFNVSLEWDETIPYEIVDESQLMAEYPAEEILEMAVRDAKPRYLSVIARYVRKRLTRYRDYVNLLRQRIRCSRRKSL